jgi:hypothetical protein
MAEHYCQRVPDPDPLVLRFSKIADDPGVCGKPARFKYQFKDLFLEEDWTQNDENEIFDLCADCYDFIHVWNEPEY